jgi:quercetin dioxygenase-like cupin family protein
MREIRTFELEHGEPAAAWRVAQPLVVKVMAGEIWLTLEGDAEDYWLAAGETFELPRGAQAWVSAGKGGARVALSFAGCEQHVRTMAPAGAQSSWRGWVPRWLTAA